MMAFLSDGEPLPISDLLGSEQVKISSVRTIARKGLENLEEKSLSTLYLALGRSTWTADDGGRDPMAPVLLVPIGLTLKRQDLQATEIQLRRRGRGTSGLTLHLSERTQSTSHPRNHSHALQQQRGYPGRAWIASES